MAVPLVIMSSGALKQWLSMTAFLLVACALLASEPAASVPSGKLAERIGEGSVVLRRRADTGPLPEVACGGRMGSDYFSALGTIGRDSG